MTATADTSTLVQNRADTNISLQKHNTNISQGSGYQHKPIDSLLKHTDCILTAAEAASDTERFDPRLLAEVKEFNLSESELLNLNLILKRTLLEATTQKAWSKAVFYLAQGIKGIKPLAECDDLNKFKGLISYLLTLETDKGLSMSGLDFGSVWCVFRDRWPTIEHACIQRDPENVKAILKDAANNVHEQAQRIAADCYQGSERMAQVASMCLALHKLNDGGDWFLSLRWIAEVLNLNDLNCPSHWMKNLRNDLIIAQVSGYTRARAARHKWIYGHDMTDAIKTVKQIEKSNGKSHKSAKSLSNWQRLGCNSEDHYERLFDLGIREHPGFQNVMSEKKQNQIIKQYAKAGF